MKSKALNIEGRGGVVICDKDYYTFVPGSVPDERSGFYFVKNPTFIKIKTQIH